MSCQEGNDTLDDVLKKSRSNVLLKLLSLAIFISLLIAQFFWFIQIVEAHLLKYHSLPAFFLPSESAKRQLLVQKCCVQFLQPHQRLQVQVKILLGHQVTGAI